VRRSWPEEPGLRRLVLVCAFLALAPAAQAAVVSVEGQFLSFDARPGEANVVSIHYTAADSPQGFGEVTITDLGAPLEPGDGCRAVGGQTVICERAGVEFNVFRLGNRADAASFTGSSDDAEFVVFAEAGADSVSLEALSRDPLGSIAVSGGGGDDTIAGGPTGEGLAGDSGDDALAGGAGNDAVWGGAGENRLDGGLGRDIAAFSDAPRGITANLATGRAVGWGRDRLSGFESLSGSRFADSLRGDANGNVLDGWEGADRLVGGAGDDRLRGSSERDRLVGGAGNDRLAGGSGNDILLARDGARDIIHGGTGLDRACIDGRLDGIRRVETLSCRSGGQLTGRHETVLRRQR
jgi:hypothetical protein